MADVPDEDIMLARVGVPWWLWKEAEASVALSRDDDDGTHEVLGEDEPDA